MPELVGLMKTTVSRASTSLKSLLPLVILLSVLFLIFIVSSLFVQKRRLSDEIKLNSIIAAKNFKEFEKLVKRQGTEKSYSLLKKAFAQNEPQAHDFAHIVGNAAYDQKKMQGISVCDSAFNYGCLHGFMEAFLVVNDISNVGVVEKACEDLGNLHSPSCLHGIGHGVMIENSYEVGKALNDCHLLAQTSQSYCFDGVFMERIVGSMLDDAAKIKLSEETIDSPCREIAYIYKAMCWRNQVNAWLIYFRADTKAAGGRCLMVEPDFYDICFESVGLNIAMNMPDTAKQVADLCAFLPGGGVADTCVIGTMKELMFEGKSVDLAKSLCTVVSPAYMQFCFGIYSELDSQYQNRFKAT